MFLGSNLQESNLYRGQRGMSECLCFRVTASHYQNINEAAA